MEVWAASVTYFLSREARMEESATEDIYQRVGEAERPEVFFKAVPWPVVTGWRADCHPARLRAQRARGGAGDRGQRRG
jgi:hypothetical protein